MQFLRITSFLITVACDSESIRDRHSASETSGATTSTSSTQNFLTFGVILMCYLFCAVTHFIQLTEHYAYKSEHNWLI